MPDRTRVLPPLLTADEALGSGDALLELKAHALGAAVALVPAAIAAFASVGRRAELQDVVAWQDPHSDLPLYALWRRYARRDYDRDPLAPHQRAAQRATVLGVPQLEHGAAHEAWLHAQGVGDRIAIYLRVAGTVDAMVMLVREPDQRRFMPSEALQLRRLQPLLEHAHATAVEPDAGTTHEVLRASGLTAREADVAELVGRGASNAEIARSLHVSEATVKTHLTRIYVKVGVRRRTQLAILLGGDR
jgi:DNA-binding CsgD family transcriptional regulator